MKQVQWNALGTRARKCLDDPHRVIRWYSPTEIARSVAERPDDARRAMYAGLVADCHVRFPRDGAGTITAVLRVFSPTGARDTLIYVGQAGGYGYDKLTAILSGVQIGGYDVSDHCQPGHRWDQIPGLAVVG